MKNIFKNKNFLLLLIGQFVSVIGDRISSAVFISIAVSIVNNIKTTYQSSLLLGVQFIPIFLFGYFFGLLADNLKKKNLMIIADVGRIIIILTLFLFHTSLIFLYFSVFLLGTFTAMFEPSRKSILPFLVKKQNLIFLNKVYATMEILAMVIGLGVGAFLLELISINDALLFDGSTYVFSLVLILFIRYKDNQKNTPIKKEIKNNNNKFKKFFQELKKGFTYLKSTPNIKYLITNMVFFHFLAASFFFSVVTDFGIRTSKLMGLQAGSNVSFVLFIIAGGALFSPLFKKLFGKLKDSKITQILFLMGSFLFFLGYIITNFFKENLKIIFVLFFLLGIIAGLQYIRYLYLIHMNTEKKYMGRIVSITEIVISITVIIGILTGSYFNEIFTYKYGFIIVSFIYLFGAISFIFSRNKISW